MSRTSEYLLDVLEIADRVTDTETGVVESLLLEVADHWGLPADTIRHDVQALPLCPCCNRPMAPYEDVCIGCR